MAAPYDQQLRQQRFTRDHPQWSIHAQDGASRFTAEKGDGRSAHIVAAARPMQPRSSPGVDAYRAFPLKGAVGRSVHDRGLTVALRVSEDLESFEATSSIEVTSPAQPWLGAVRLADNGDLDWECDWRAAFHGDPAQLADVIAPILRAYPPQPPARRSPPSTLTGHRSGAGREDEAHRLPTMPNLPGTRHQPPHVFGITAYRDSLRTLPASALTGPGEHAGADLRAVEPGAAATQEAVLGHARRLAARIGGRARGGARSAGAPRRNAGTSHR